MPKIGTPENPLRVAIVGAGPSGFYAAEHILKDGDVHAQVDLFDRLPTPFGLVRGRVAPDHPKIKSMRRVYEKPAARDGFRFFGNVKIGHDIEVEELEGLYHAIVYTVGCETDRALGVPGEDLAGSPAASACVGRYDAPHDAVETRDRKGTREIVVRGRRGPVQAAFTNPEIKELGVMEDADVIVDPADLELDAASAAFLASEEADKTTRVQ